MTRDARILGLLGCSIFVSFLFATACDCRGDAQPNAGAGQHPQGIAWFHDLYEAHQVSVATGKPMLILFGATWCHYCKELEAKTLTNPNLAAYISTYYVPVHLDTDRDKRVTEILKAKPIPCTIILSPDANFVARFVGYEEPRPYFNELEKNRQRYLHLQHQKVTSN
jgi:thiol-disulfide isomerase/thioredoxin